MPITISLLFLVDIKSISIGTWLRENITITGKTTQTQVIGTSENQSHWNDY